MKLNAKISIAGLPLNNAGGGATSWDDLAGKPFDTLSDDFVVDNGELKLAESGGSVEIDNKSLIEVDGKIQEAVPLYSEGEEVIKTINSAVFLDREQSYKPEWYFSPVEFSMGVDVTDCVINFTYNGINTMWDHFNITSPQTLTDSKGNTWTTTSNLEYEDADAGKKGYYIKFTLVDGTNEQGNVSAEFINSTSGEINFNQEISLDNKWNGYNINMLLQNAETYPIIPRVYFSYYCGNSYDLYRVSASANDVDVSQPVSITDDNGVVWALTVTPNADHSKDPYIDLSTENLPSDFQYFDNILDEISQENGNLGFEYISKVAETVVHQLPAEYAPIDNDTIQNVNGKLVAVQQGGSGISNVEYEDLTGGQGQQIGTLRVTNRQGVAETYVYAPSGGGSVEIDNKSLITNDQGKVQMAVPLYTEQVEHSYEGLKFTSFNYPAGNDLDCYLPVNNNTITLSQYYDVYLITTSNEVWSGRWDSTGFDGYAYGCYGSINFTNGTQIITSEIYWSLEGDYRVHVYMNSDVILGESGGSTGNISALVFVPVNTADTLHSQLSSLGLDSYWGTINTVNTETIIHKLPTEYIPIDNNTIRSVDGKLVAVQQGGQSYQGKNGVNVSNSVISLNSDINAFGGIDFGYKPNERPLKDGTGKVSNYIGGGIVKTTSNNSTDDIKYTTWPRLNFDGTLSTRREVWASSNFVSDTSYRKVQATTPYYKYYNNEWFGPYYITGMFIGEYDPNSTPKYNIRIEGWESILDSITWDGNNSRYVFTFKNDICIDPVETDVPFPFIFVTGIDDIPDPQKVNAYFLPVDNNTVKVNSDGNIYADVQGGSVEIDNKSLIEVDGVVQEAVPLYAENSIQEYTFNSATAGYQD